MLRPILILMASAFILLSTVTPAFGEENETAKPEIHSKAAILIDAATGEVLYEKNGDKKMYPASITKILTAIIAIEKGDLEDIVTVSKNARSVEGTTVYLLEGEKVKLSKLVEGMLINSGNDAAIAIAEHISGSVEGFAQKMNEFAREEIGVENSHFVNPHGLFDEAHYTTAYDMAVISKYAMKNASFRDIVATEQLKWNGEGWDTTLYNHNRMLRRYKGANGVKNGWTTKSGYTLVSSATRNDMDLVAVTLNAKTRKRAYNDATNLLNYGFKTFERDIVSKGSTFKKAGEVYIVPETIRYTKKIRESVSIEVSHSESLVIKGKKNGRVIDKYSIVHLEPEAGNKNEQQKDKEGGLKALLFNALDVLVQSHHYLPNIWVTEAIK